ncbi:phage tail protein [Pseudomonas sp. 5P_3.1_Bac2]|uniref:phage tail protein n=1 Tax=Pseudomonas sp. 5P_3.1_Bac2 TaxID=2971617 RepID=UPI0021C7C53C|nr:phage tail protein [Pseudomonas sp. 5P_3.1_Bac2]MCU1718671.1 phage tail protein [Pseudomonas sp. 5P_3.1_Bac2]
MIWALLGEIEFELLNHPSSLAERGTSDYAEHARMQGKPLLQWVGEGLQELSLEIALHAALVNPEAQIANLKKAKSAHQPLPLVLGSGDYRGVFVLTALDVTTSKTDEAGRLIVARVSLTLREYSGAYSKPLAAPQALRSAGLFNALALSALAVLPQNARQQALSLSKKAGNLLGSAGQLYSTVQTLSSNPVQLLAQTPRLLSQSAQILPPLQALQGVAQQLAEGAELVQLASDAYNDVDHAVQALQAVNLNNVAKQVQSASDSIDSAATRLNTAAPRLSQLAAKVLTRSP